MGFFKQLIDRPSKKEKKPTPRPQLVFPQHSLGVLDDLLPLIISYCDPPTLRSISLASQRCHALSMPHLYRHVYFDCTRVPSYTPRWTYRQSMAVLDRNIVNDPGDWEEIELPSVPMHLSLSGWAVTPSSFAHTTHITMRCHTETCGHYLFYPLPFPRLHTVRLDILDAYRPSSVLEDNTCQAVHRGPTFLQMVKPRTVVHFNQRNVGDVGRRPVPRDDNDLMVTHPSVKRLVVVIPTKPVTSLASLDAMEVRNTRELYPCVEEVTLVLQNFWDEGKKEERGDKKWLRKAKEASVDAWRVWLLDILATFCAWWPTRVKVVGAEGVERGAVGMPRDGGGDVGEWIEREVRRKVGMKEVETDIVWDSEEERWTWMDELVHEGREVRGEEERVMEKQASIEFVRLGDWLDDTGAWQDVLDVGERAQWKKMLESANGGVSG
ncbi:hypothetical protein IAT38_005515 [Cryptococcus sp. DSM 104549]